MTKIVIEDRMLLSDRRKVVDVLKPAIFRLMESAEYPVIAEQIKRLRETVNEQEKILDEAGSEILRHMR